MWLDLTLYTGETIHLNVSKADNDVFAGVNEAGEETVIPKSKVQSFKWGNGNNDYYGYDSSTGGVVGLGYG